MTARAQVQSRIRGLYGIADAEASGGDPVELGRQLLAGGCRLVQLRCKGWSADDVRQAARELLEACNGVDATLIVNDHPAIAAEIGAHGVHIGQTDGDPAAARAALGEDGILGLSTNDLEAVVPAGKVADYVAFGPVFDTHNISRPKRTQGPSALAVARSLLPASIPLVAIGGINRRRLPQVQAAGVSAWAVIGAVAAAADPTVAARALLA